MRWFLILLEAKIANNLRVKEAFVKRDIIQFLAISIVAVILTSGCIVIDLNGCGMKTVKGSGNLVTEDRSLSEFNQISLKGKGKVTLRKGDRHNFKIRTDDNVLPLIETEVRNGKLEISHSKWNLRPTTLDYYITVKDLRGVSIAGSGDINGKDRFVSDEFYTDVSGSGNILLDLEVDQLDSDISGSGSTLLSGKANSYHASITGSGKISAFDLEAKNASINITGSGDCRVNVSEKLRAKITGSGDVRYKGFPRITKKITGSGSVNGIN
jgi:hypothetical protein